MDMEKIKKKVRPGNRGRGKKRWSSQVRDEKPWHKKEKDKLVGTLTGEKNSFWTVQLQLRLMEREEEEEDESNSITLLNKMKRILRY